MFVLWGSLAGDKIGGHNVLEPAALGVPVITGPSYYNFKEIVEMMQVKSLISIVNNTDQLAQSITVLFEDRSLRNTLQNDMTQFYDINSGTIAKTLNAVKEIY